MEAQVSVETQASQVCSPSVASDTLSVPHLRILLPLARRPPEQAGGVM